MNEYDEKDTTAPTDDDLSLDARLRLLAKRANDSLPHDELKQAIQKEISIRNARRRKLVRSLSMAACILLLVGVGLFAVDKAGLFSPLNILEQPTNSLPPSSNATYTSFPLETLNPSVIGDTITPSLTPDGSFKYPSGNVKINEEGTVNLVTFSSEASAKYTIGEIALPAENRIVPDLAIKEGWGVTVSIDTYTSTVASDSQNKEYYKATLVATSGVLDMKVGECLINTSGSIDVALWRIQSNVCMYVECVGFSESQIIAILNSFIGETA